MGKLRPEDVMAIIDTREQQPFDLHPLLSRRATLQTGDYSVDGLQFCIALERKSLADLLGCIGNSRDRFEKCIERLLEFDSKVIIVESTWEYFLSGNWSSFGPREPGGHKMHMGPLSRIYPMAAIGSVLGWIERGIPIIFAGNPQQASLCAARFLYLAAKRRQSQEELQNAV